MIPLAYDEILYFSEDLCGVRRGNKWGYINKAGAVSIALNYEEVSPFMDGQALVKKVITGC